MALLLVALLAACSAFSMVENSVAHLVDWSVEKAYQRVAYLAYSTAALKAAQME